jgi:asparagine synthase (glutamine-hydrolysing)
VAEFFLRGEVDVPRPSHETLYRGICQLPPAHAFELRLDGTWRCWRYWSLEEVGEEPAADPAREFADLFEESVRLRLRSDVPVGAFLSGGLDSTSILCSMSRQMDAVGPGQEPLRAFCYHAEGFDETRYVADTIRETGARHVVLRASPGDLWESLDRFFWHQEEPVYSITAVVGYKLAELAASHGVKVVLNGQGSDEMLGGYRPFFASYWHTLLRRLRLLDAWREIGAYGREHGVAASRLFLATLVRFAKVQLQSFEPYRAWSSRRERLRLAGDPWYAPELTRHLGLGDARDHVGGIRHVLAKSLARFPLPFYLRVEDRNSMAHSVETRLPFLDHRLVELARRMSPDWFLKGPWNKLLLRESMRGRIPESVRSRVDKMGFPTPMAAWFRGPLHARVREVVTSRELRERGIYDAAAIERDLERHRRGEIDCANKLWDVVQWERIVRVASRGPAFIPAGEPAGSVGSA